MVISGRYLGGEVHNKVGYREIRGIMWLDFCALSFFEIDFHFNVTAHFLVALYFYFSDN
jgi:hypothetical protein